MTHERRFHGEAGRLRSPERVAVLEVERVVTLSLEGCTAHSVLDVGTGSGLFAEAFARRGLEVTGIDVSAEMLEVAQSYVPKGRFREGVAEQIPYPACSFDLVFMGLVLHETDDRHQALVEARRVARLRVVALEWPHDQGTPGPPLKHRLRPAEVEALAQEAGLSKAIVLRLANTVLYRLDL